MVSKTRQGQAQPTQFRSRGLEAEILVAGGRVDKDVFDGAVVGDGLGRGVPVGGVEIGVELQIETGGGRGP